MAEQLFPVFQSPAIIDSSYNTEYRRSAKWDLAAGDFVRDGANKIMECDGYDAYGIWCYKIAQTERYACLAYGNEIGTEMELATGQDDESTIESMVERTITDALKVNPRTEYVRDFSFVWNGSEMHCSFTVKGIEHEKEIRITL